MKKDLTEEEKIVLEIGYALAGGDRGLWEHLGAALRARVLAACERLEWCPHSRGPVDPAVPHGCCDECCR